MRKVEVDPWPGIENDVRQAAERLGLQVKGLAQKSLPGSVHLHLSKAGKTGTLEFTNDTVHGLAWFSVHENREGEWTDQAIADLLGLLGSGSREA